MGEYDMMPLEKVVGILLDKVDRLEAAVVALCEQDGEVTYERGSE